MSDSRKIFIGVAWPYVNGDLHIGHLAGYLLPADITARFHKAIGNDVLMISGSDCFGTPITVEADKRKVKPEDIVDEYHAKTTDLLLNTLSLSYSLYTKTNTPNHIKTTQDIFVKMVKNGDIVIDSQNQYYSPTEDKFLPDRYVEGKCSYCGFEGARSDQCDNCGKLLDHETLLNPVSKETGNLAELKETTHYFVDWPKLQPKIQKFVEEKGGAWKNWIKQETQGWLNEGLNKRAITRDLDWGVPIPVDRLPEDMVIEGHEHKRIYVWFDAVIGYLSGSIEHDSEAYKDWWYNTDARHYYFMGKDNLPFHTLFWPGQLISYDENLNLPDLESINMYLNLDGQKFSKSRNVVVDTKEFIETYGNDAARFYLTLIMPELRDSSFVWEDFEEKVNGILVANLGNFIHRVLSIGQGYKISGNINPDQGTYNVVQHTFSEVRKTLEACEFRETLNNILSLSAAGNHYIDKTLPWELKNADEKRFGEVMSHLYLVVVALGYLMQPLMPEASNNLANQLGLDFSIWPEGVEDLLKDLEKLDNTKKPTPLFNKIELEK